MIKQFLPLLLIWCITLGTIMSCDPKEESISGSSSLRLSYSMDTVTFDTLLSSRASITERLIVRNTNDEALEIDNIYLGLDEDSPYNIYVNGVEGASFDGQVIYGKDSMLILVEIFFDPRDEDLPYFLKDSVNLLYNGNHDHVKLVTWGQDANYLTKQTLDCNTSWVKGKPYVLSDTITVAEGCTLTMEEGTRVYLDISSAIAVNGTLVIEGEASDRVEIKNSRFDEPYDTTIGQWGSIHFTATSRDNVIQYSDITNGTIGLSFDNSQAYISNVSINKMSSAGVSSVSSQLEIYNSEIYTCRRNLIRILEGGDLIMDHCTLAGGFREPFTIDGSLVISDSGEDAIELNVSVRNSIVWGRSNDELALTEEREGSTVTITNNILRTMIESLESDNQVSQERSYPMFALPTLQLREESPAIDMAPESLMSLDLLDSVRDDKPDIGAYEWFNTEPVEEENE